MTGELNPGDLIVVKGKGPLSGVEHVSLVVSVFGRPLIYESTTDERPQCVRTGRDEPVGVQAHFVEDMLAINPTAKRLSLVRPLYPDEEDRLLSVAESCLGRGYDYVGGKTSSAFVARVLSEVGVLHHRKCRHFSPRRLVKFVMQQGIYGNLRPLYNNSTDFT